MIILTTNTNLNGTRFTEDFIDGICNNQKDFQGIALVVNRAKLENEEYDNLTHELNSSTNTLGTDMIGSFVAFEKADNEDGSKSLVGEARIMKRFPKTCNAIAELYESGELRFSCEVLVRKYENTEDNYREVSYHSGLNSLIANCIVSTPAEVEAKPTLLVASLNEDLMSQVGATKNTELSSGGVNMALSLGEKRKLMNEFASKLAKKVMAKVRADQVLESAELADIDMGLVDGVIGLLGSDFSANSYMGLWVGEELVFDQYFVAQDYYNGNLYMFDYSINEEDTLSASNPRKAKFELVEVAEQVLASISKRASEIFAEKEAKEVEIASLQTEKEEVQKELETKSTELSTLQSEKEGVENQLKDKETELAEVQKQVQVKDEALTTTQTEANEKIIQLGEVVDGLKTKLKEVEPVIEEYNRVQAELAEQAKAAQKQTLIKYALSSKLIEEKELSENEEIKLAIAELDEVKIKSIVADRIVKANVELSNNANEDRTKDEDVIVTASESKDLIQPSIKEKYGL
jgi:predicted  nucleic acid-binding Zn-ribbon protein